MRLKQSRLGVQSAYPANDRRGFTLIELLIVMVIILLLSGMLLGAVLLVRARVVQAQQMAELTQIDIALKSFQTKYGVYPPSRIRLRNYDGSSDPKTDSYALDDPFDVHSIAYLRRIWPSIKLPIRATKTDTTLTIEQPVTPLKWYVDTSGSGTVPKYADLEGDQCLVFFLGGIAERRGPNEFVLHGFTNDQTNPSRIADSSTPITLSRTPVGYNFDASRLYVRSDYPNLVDQNARLAEQSYGTTITDFYANGATPGTAYLGRFPSYKVMNADSSNPLPVAYFSSYEGRGYRPDDLNIPEPVTLNADGDGINFQLVWPIITKTNDDSNYPTQKSLEPNPYTRGPAGLGTNSAPLRAATTVIQPYSNKTYQIILPGPDNQYGAGGAQADYQGTGWTENADNLASFAGGTPVGEFVTQQK